VAFSWIHLAFTTVLPIEEVLLLWDRIIGYDTLEILPVLATAVFLWRQEVLLCCNSEKEVKDVFGKDQFNRIRIVPVLQGFLWADHFKV
jgi:hypothetical protein